MRLTGVTSIPSPVTGLRAGMQVDPPAGDATSESKPTRAVHNTPPGSQPSSPRSDAQARAVSPPPPPPPCTVTPSQTHNRNPTNFVLMRGNSYGRIADIHRALHRPSSLSLFLSFSVDGGIIEMYYFLFFPFSVSLCFSIKSTKQRRTRRESSRGTQH